MMANKFLVWLKDTGERVGFTFLESLGAVWFADDILDRKEFVDMGIYEMAGLAALTSLFALVKAALASRLGNQSSASAIPDLPKEQVIADPPTKEGMG